MVEPKNGSTPITLKSLVTALAVTASCLGIAQAVLSYFFLPTVVQASVYESKKLIEEHAQHTHVNSVTRVEFQMLMRQIDKLATQDSVNNLAHRIEGLERELRSKDK